MNKALKTLYYFLLLLVLNCKKDNLEVQPQSNINKDFQPFVNKFLEEANIRGKKFDFNKTPLNIKFQSPKLLGFGNNAAYCLPNLPRTIIVDSLFWFSQIDIYKELIIFHELGHCLLGRGHLNLLTQSNEFRSMMYGEPISPEIISAYSFNFWGMRRKYYIDELFNTSVALPSWANITGWEESIKAEQKIKVYEEVLRDIESSKKMILSKKSLVSFENEAMKIVSSDNGEFISIAGITEKTSLWKNKNFEIEVRLKLEGGIKWNVFGPTFEILFNEQKRNFLYSYIVNLHLGGQNTYWQENENVIKLLNIIDKNAIHTLSVRNDNNLLYWFFDNQLQYISENLYPQTPQNYSFSFNLDKNTTAWLYSIKVSEIIK